MKLNSVFALLVVLCYPASVFSAPLDPAALGEFIQSMESDHGFDKAKLEKLFEGTERSDRILELMSRPAEKVKPWWEYRALFISDKRIRDGVKFWGENLATLEQATEKTGVSPEIIVAIIGIETSYGRVTGSYKVIEALATLAFHYPGNNVKRGRFFAAQLEHFLLLAREDSLDPMSLLGSYAGAMGIPQFMPENYRKLAVDFNDDGKRDIWTSPADAIGSVANYFTHHGWIPDAPVMSPARVASENVDAFLQKSIKPAKTLAEFERGNIRPTVENSNQDESATLFQLTARDGHEYWLGYTNFYVISRYNPRVKYAMAVAQLAAAIRAKYNEQGD
jgi:membrane-bound lytic murein transglycosylase B